MAQVVNIFELPCLSNQNLTEVKLINYFGEMSFFKKCFKIGLGLSQTSELRKTADGRYPSKE